MTEEKGLPAEVADKIWSYVQMHGNADLITKLRTDAKLLGHKSAIEALNDLELLFRYLTLYNVMDRVNETNHFFIETELNTTIHLDYF